MRFASSDHGTCLAVSSHLPNRRGGKCFLVVGNRNRLRRHNQDIKTNYEQTRAPSVVEIILFFQVVTCAQTSAQKDHATKARCPGSRHRGNHEGLKVPLSGVFLPNPSSTVVPVPKRCSTSVKACLCCLSTCKGMLKISIQETAI